MDLLDAARLALFNFETSPPKPKPVYEKMKEEEEQQELAKNQ
jgi:hypothetical protein